MACCRDCFSFCFIAHCARVGLYAGLSAGRSRCNLTFVPRVTLCGNLSLNNDNLIADGAVLTLGLARSCACRFYCRVYHFRMARCEDVLAISNFFAASLAVSITGVAFFCAGCSLGIMDFGLTMCTFPLCIEGNIFR